MFGLSFGEVIILMLVALVVVGPRNLPQMMRSLGRTMGKARRMANDLREHSKIDEILRAEGIEREVQELHKLATGRILDVNFEEDPPAQVSPPPYEPVPPRSREYPVVGPDGYGALPDDAIAYRGDVPADDILHGTVARGAVAIDTVSDESLSHLAEVGSKETIEGEGVASTSTLTDSKGASSQS